MGDRRLDEPTPTEIQRHFGQSIAHRDAGHAGPRRRVTISVYTKVTLREVAQALAALAGEPHPLADGDLTTVMLTPKRGSWLNCQPPPKMSRQQRHTRSGWRHKIAYLLLDVSADQMKMLPAAGSI